MYDIRLTKDTRLCSFILCNTDRITVEITKIFLFLKPSKYKGQRAKNCHIKKKDCIKASEM